MTLVPFTVCHAPVFGDSNPSEADKARLVAHQERQENIMALLVSLKTQFLSLQKRQQDALDTWPSTSSVDLTHLEE